MNCKDIILNYLKNNGYTGLLNVDFECGCKIDHLCPCDEISIDMCESGYIHYCEKCQNKCNKYNIEYCIKKE